MLCYTQKWVVHWSLKFWVFTCCQKLSVEWHWIKFLEPDFLAFRSIYFLQQSRLVNWTAITDCVNNEWIYSGGSRGVTVEAISPLKPAKVTLFAMIFYNSHRTGWIRSPNRTGWIRSWFTRNTKHGFDSWKWPYLTWNSSGSVPIYFSVLPLSGRQMPHHEKHSDIGKMMECVWQYVSLKNSVSFWELQLPNLRFRFTVVIKSRRLPRD